MAYKHCNVCDEGMPAPKLREALLDGVQVCENCNSENYIPFNEGLEMIVDDWEETHTFDGQWEQRNE